MFEKMLRKLTVWRSEEAQKEGVELFRILPNRTLEEVARKCPRTKAELIEIKGIKEAKFNKYGKEILGIISEAGQGEGFGRMEDTEQGSDLAYFRRGDLEKKGKIFSVGEFWDVVNEKLWSFQVKIKGEISSVDARNNVIYFNLKDGDDGSVISCLIFRYQYEILGVDLHEGMEVVVEGYPEVYKPYGKLSFKVSVIEPEGEGVLKKEYEKLKAKLEAGGLFDESGKRKFIKPPQNIGLITSREGAAIGDFMSNIGKFGLKIRLINSSVEGKRAVFELVKAVQTFSGKDIDALVIVRGGGSLESLQAFNNEALVREAKKIKVPVVCGVGHDKDISLLSLAADYSMSTPTAASRLIGSLWEREVDKIDFYAGEILQCFGERFLVRQERVEECARNIDRGFHGVLEEAENSFSFFLGTACGVMEKAVLVQKMQLASAWESCCLGFENQMWRTQGAINQAENSLKLNDPERQLRMGYAVVSKGGKSIKSVKEMQKGDSIKIRLADGEAESEIVKINCLKK